MSKHRITPRQSKLLKRIEKVARRAALERLTGRINQAMHTERRLDSLFQSADEERLSGAGLGREERGREAAHNLAKKLGRNK
jgi:hypothetical protein